MFNICLPADHPINQQGIPEGFSPIFPQLQSSDINRHMAFPPDSYLGTTSVEKSHGQNDSSYVSFSSIDDKRIDTADAEE